MDIKKAPKRLQKEKCIIIIQTFFHNNKTEEAKIRYKIYKNKLTKILKYCKKKFYKKALEVIQKH